MGKTTDPLKLLMDEVLYNTPEVQELIEQGHSVQIMGHENLELDGFLGAKQWRMTPELIKYLPMAIKAIRKEKKDAGRPRGQKVKPKKAAKGPKSSKQTDSTGNIPAGGTERVSAWSSKLND